MHSVLISLFADFTTMLLSYVTFGGITYLSIFTTMIFTPIVECILILVVPMLFFGNVFQIVDIVESMSNFAIDFAHTLSDFEYVYAAAD